MLGFELDVWDYWAFAALFALVIAGLSLAVFVLGLPGRIAISRKHPEAEAVNLMGWAGFLAIVPWMVAGIVRVGGIASFICDSGRYLLATYYTENLKYVKIGQPVELLLGLYPGQIFRGKVDSIWWANGEGQFLPSDVIPNFESQGPKTPQDQFAVKIDFEDPNAPRFPIGAQGGAAIYTSSHGGFVALRHIAIRMNSWFNWLYPMPF